MFRAALVTVAAAYHFCNGITHASLWGAFILPCRCATPGDLRDANGGMAFRRNAAAPILAALIVAYVALLPQRAGTHPGQPEVTRT